MVTRSSPAQYARLKRLAAHNVNHADVAALLLEVTDHSLLLLRAECEDVVLTSGVPGKEYLAHRLGNRMSRPVDRGLFIPLVCCDLWCAAKNANRSSEFGRHWGNASHQWKLDQQFIARIERIYYLDPPQVYADLAGFPRISVKKFGEFFREKDALIAGQI